MKTQHTASDLKAIRHHSDVPALREHFVFFFYFVFFFSSATIGGSSRMLPMSRSLMSLATRYKHAPCLSRTKRCGERHTKFSTRGINQPAHGARGSGAMLIESRVGIGITVWIFYALQMSTVIPAHHGVKNLFAKIVTLRREGTRLI